MKDVNIIKKRVRKTQAGYADSWDAEIELEVTEKRRQKRYFVRVSKTLEYYDYTLSKKSYIDYTTKLTKHRFGRIWDRISYIECYGALDPTFDFDVDDKKQWAAVMKSGYAEYFKMAKDMIDGYKVDIL